MRPISCSGILPGIPTGNEKYLVKQVARSLHLVGYSGGGPQLKARLSGNYSTVDGITADGKNGAIAVSMAIDFTSNNQKFKVSVSAGFNNTMSDMREIPILTKLAPNAPPVLDDAGEINFKEYAGTNGLIEGSGIQ